MFDLEKAAKVYNRLSDQESRDIFNLQINRFLNPEYKWKLPMKYLHGNISLPVFDDWYKDKKGYKLTVFGGGTVGLYTVELLKAAGKTVSYICETVPKNEYTEISDGRKIQVISLDELAARKDCAIVIASTSYASEMYESCLRKMIPAELIYYPMRRYLYGYNYNQYFDFFEPQQGEIFVDAGAYDGMTSVMFSKWCNNSHDGIYLFEANAANKQKISDVLARHNINNANVIMKGTWSEDTEVSFEIDTYLTTGSRINMAVNTNKVPVTSIDNALLGKKVTFIKMDVEGSEFQSLLGCKETIKKYHPRMAISVYHLSEDICEIPRLLMDMDDTYRIAFRVYASDFAEIIMYAW